MEYCTNCDWQSDQDGIRTECPRKCGGKVTTNFTLSYLYKQAHPSSHKQEASAAPA